MNAKKIGLVAGVTIVGATMLTGCGKTSDFVALYGPAPEPASEAADKAASDDVPDVESEDVEDFDYDPGRVVADLYGPIAD